MDDTTTEPAQGEALHPAAVSRRVSGAIATGPLAERAMARWTASRLVRVVDCQGDAPRPTPGSAVLAEPARRRVEAAIDPELLPPATYEAGRGVWIPEPDGRWSRGVVLGPDPLVRRYLVAWVDIPHKQAYVAYHRLRPRFVGEAAPGVDMDGRRAP